MSVTTTADRCLAVVSSSLKEAYENLQVVLEENMEGSTEYRQEYIDTLWDAATKIAYIRRGLK